MTTTTGEKITDFIDKLPDSVKTEAWMVTAIATLRNNSTVAMPQYVDFVHTAFKFAQADAIRRTLDKLFTVHKKANGTAEIEDHDFEPMFLAMLRLYEAIEKDYKKSATVLENLTELVIHNATKESPK